MAVFFTWSEVSPLKNFQQFRSFLYLEIRIYVKLGKSSFLCQNIVSKNITGKVIFTLLFHKFSFLIHHVFYKYLI